MCGEFPDHEFPKEASPQGLWWNSHSLLLFPDGYNMRVDGLHNNLTDEETFSAVMVTLDSD